MKDIYIAFYELSLKMVKPGGKICYITPNSWFTSKAGDKLRKYLYDNKILSHIIDYGHTQVFDGVTTYVEITLIDNRRQPLDGYVVYEDMATGKRTAIPYPAFKSEGKFYFMDPERLTVFDRIQSTKTKAPATVKNGFATLADKIFIHDGKMDDSPYVIPVVKSSTGKGSWCIYPYDRDGNLVDEWDFSRSAPNSRDYLTDNKGKLLDRDTDEPYYAFGRTQAISDTYKTKYAIKNIVRTEEDLKPLRVPAGTGVYGGLYIQCDYPLFIDSLNWGTFLEYVKSLKKYKSGGYYTYSSKDLQKFLDWAWEMKPETVSYIKF
jgi:adenine-specific DNA-methyltransferase